MHETPDRSPTAEKILDAAEDRARTGGYDGFSFRDIAAELGIKSASVHYHFPTKADLASALIERYTDEFLAGLGNSSDPGQPVDALLHGYVATFRRMLVDEELMCLGGIFGAETGKLPLAAASGTRDFFARQIDWLTPLFQRRGARDPQAAAMALVAQLEGALIVARTLGSTNAFDRIATEALRR